VHTPFLQARFIICSKNNKSRSAIVTIITTEKSPPVFMPSKYIYKYIDQKEARWQLTATISTTNDFI